MKEDNMGTVQPTMHELEMELELDPMPPGYDEKRSLVRNNTKVEEHVGNSRKLVLWSVFYAGCLVVVCLLAVVQLSRNSHKVNSAYSGNVGLDGVSPYSFHQSSFGGPRNLAHPAGARSLIDGDVDAEVHIPISKVARAVPSLHRENILNYWGHYAHDEHQSPFASFLYDRPEEELKQEQAEFLAKMNQVRKEWGSWNFYDKKKTARPIVDLGKLFDYKDFTYDKLDDNVWQKDNAYVTSFLDEAEKLVERVTEGIYTEYGSPTKKADGSTLNEEEIEARNRLFGLDVREGYDPKINKDISGAAWMTERAFDALVKKLLHAMMTNDEFYVIMGGHSAAAGHGNNFLQSYMMSFHYLMEPVFNHLGVRLISRNLAMGGLGTLHFSLGAATLYGEADFLIWDSSMTEKDRGSKDLFNKQALLSGERAPIIFTNEISDLVKETDETILHGDLLGMLEVIPITEDLRQVETLPWATQYMECSSQCKGLCNEKEHRYNGQCWVPRKDMNATRAQKTDGVGGQASWHPGNRVHQFTGRKIALTMLHGLKAAIETWKEGIDTDGFPIKETYWHVGDMYKTLQTKLETNLKNNEEEDECEKRFPTFSRACHLGMSGMAEFTPNAAGDNGSIRRHLTPAPNGYVPNNLKNVYSGPDLMPLKWKIPHGEVDVHAIAIATNYKEASLNDQWGTEGNHKNDQSRQLLRRQLEKKLKSSLGSPPSQDQVNEEMILRTEKSSNNRQLEDTKIIPGQGWEMTDPNAGFCDGSSMSTCNRYDNDCLLSGHNDHRSTISGDCMSGWIVIKIPKLMHGYIISRIQWWHPNRTERSKGWTEINNGKTIDTRPYFNETTGLPNIYEDGDRKLSKSNQIMDEFVVDEMVDRQRRTGGKVTPLPDDFEFDIAINGRIWKTMNVTEFMVYTKEVAYNQAIFTLYDDETTVEKHGVELALRVRCSDSTAHTGISISHIYYA